MGQKKRIAKKKIGENKSIIGLSLVRVRLGFGFIHSQKVWLGSAIQQKIFTNKDLYMLTY